jgi:DNA-binding CsgD family transcriptional regulator
VPRGPFPTTRANPFGLTARQVDILALVGDDLTNAEIATRLGISAKTVDHHVGAVLAKLGVHSRKAAAAMGAATRAGAAEIGKSRARYRGSV